MLNKIKYLGPGLLYAGAAVGVSHLVQSTRAGAQFGIAMVWVILLANLLKYPFFLMGPLYASIEGKSILHGYQKLGKWSLWLFQLLTISTMFAVIAAIAIVTSGLAEQIFSLGIHPKWWSVVVLGTCSVILLVGRYHFLDKMIKYVILLLSLTTLVAFVMSFGIDQEISQRMIAFDWKDNSHLFFLIAFIGWMPAPMDISVWHSSWAVEKSSELGRKETIDQTLLDFNVGYIGTVVLAICFLVLGAKVFYGSGAELSASGVEFAGQLIGIYSQLIGSWAFYLIASAAFLTMFSTCITCLDAFPRVVDEAACLIFDTQKRNYSNVLFVLASGAIGILFLYLDNMKQMVDFATTVSFITTPILATLNFVVFEKMNHTNSFRWGLFRRGLIWGGFVFLYGFTAYFVWVKFIN